jgi:hypothetical protein
MRVNEYVVLSECIEAGVRYGVSRAFKYTDEPSQSEIERDVESAVMSAICEKFIFDSADPEANTEGQTTAKPLSAPLCSALLNHPKTTE